MKRYVNVICAAVLVFALFAQGEALAKEFKVGYVDLSRTFDEYTKTQDSDGALESKTKAREAERNTMVEDIKRLKEEIVLLSEKKQQTQQDQIDEKIKALQDFDQEARNTLREERDNMVREILEEIDAVIQKYGKDNGYTVILNDRVLLYGDDTIEISQDIIDILNAGYKKKQ